MNSASTRDIYVLKDDNELEVGERTTKEGRSSDPVFCQICGIFLSDLGLNDRQLHYENHFSDVVEVEEVALATATAAPTPSSSKSKRSSPKPAIARVLRLSNEQMNAFWHYSQDSDPPRNYAPGIIPVLKEALLKTHARGLTTRAVLCYERTVHISCEIWDRTWGCGYRNFLMACTALMDQDFQPDYFPALDSPVPPGVRNLQKWIEAAWEAGFDEEGAAELKHKLVGTMKWIGTVELYVAFLSRGIPSRLVDFPKVSKNDNKLVEWVERYFTAAGDPSSSARKLPHSTATVGDALRGASPVLVTDRMPLILQHQGHSCTIVGFEKSKDGSTNLLMFDPSKTPLPAVRKAALAHYCSSRCRTTESPSSTKHHITPLKSFKKMFHSRQHGTNADAGPSRSTESSASSKRRPIDLTLSDDDRDRKRVRGGLHPRRDDVIKVDDGATIADDSDVEVVESPAPRGGGLGCESLEKDTSETPEKLDPTRTLNGYRLRPKLIGKKDRYQILYFPLGDLLSEEQRQARRVVTSEVIE